MITKWALNTVLCCVLLTCASQPVCAEDVLYPQWPMLFGNAQHMNCGMNSRCATNIISWSNRDASTGAQPVIGHDGTLYINVGYLMALNPDGSVLWRHTEDDGYNLINTPAIDNAETIYAASSDTLLYAFNSDGSVKWTLPINITSHMSPVIGPDGAVYICSDQRVLNKIDPDGTLLWAFTSTGYSPAVPACASDGTVYMLMKGGGGTKLVTLHAVSPDGYELWQYHINGDRFYGPVVTRDGTILVNVDSNLHAISSRGGLKWVHGIKISGYPAIAPDGTIIFFNSRSLKALATDGLMQWSVEMDDYGELTPVIGGDGSIYLVAASHLFAFSSGGELMWKIDGRFSQPSLGADGTLYSSKDGALHAFAPATGFNVLKTIPENGTTGIHPLSSVYFDFTEYVDPETVTGESIQVSGSKSGPVPGETLLYGNTMVFRPFRRFTPGERIDVSYDEQLAGSLTGTHLNEGCVLSFSIMEHDDSNDPHLWRMSGANHRHTNRLDGVPCATPEILWTYAPENEPMPEKAPVIGCERSLYYIRRESLLAIDTTPSKRWNYRLKWRFSPAYYRYSPAVGPEGNVYCVDEGTLTALGSDGKILWAFQDTTSYRPELLTPTIGLNGAIYVADKRGTLYVLEPDGTLRWNVQIDSYFDSPPSIDYTGMVYASSSYLYAFNTDGSIRWKSIERVNRDYSPAICPEGILFAVCSGDGIVAYNTVDGSELWRFEECGRVYSAPALGADGSIFFDSENGFYSLDQGGAMRWHRDDCIGQPVIAGDGTVYVQRTEALSSIRTRYHVAALDHNGTEKWSHILQSPLGTDPVIGPDGALYVVDQTSLIVFAPDVETDVTDAAPEPLSLTAFPNPFNPSTTISFTLPDYGHASLAVYNLAGQKVRTLADSPMASGRHTIVWDGRDDTGNAVATGIYFTRLTAGNTVATGKLALVK